MHRLNALAIDGEHLQPSPDMAARCFAFGVEGALRPLADSVGQALSRFMPSASIHNARLIFTFWSMP